MKSCLCFAVFLIQKWFFLLFSKVTSQKRDIFNTSLIYLPFGSIGSDWSAGFGGRKSISIRWIFTCFVKHEDDALVVQPLCLVLMWLFMIEWGSEGAIINPGFNLGQRHSEFIDKVPEYRSRSTRSFNLQSGIIVWTLLCMKPISGKCCFSTQSCKWQEKFHKIPLNVKIWN